MSLFGLLEKRSTFANPSETLLGMFGGGRATDSGIQVSEQSALSLPAFYACVDVIARAMSTLPIHLYRRLPDGSRVVATDLPVAALMSAPNEETSGSAFQKVQMNWLLTWGNGYAEIERNNAGEPIALHQLPPTRVIPRRRRGDHRIEYYLARAAMESPYVLEQQVTTDLPSLDRDDMLHFAGLGWDGIVGYNPICIHREALGLGLATQQYGARYFGNSGVPSGILESDKPIKDPQKLRAAWKLAHGGSGQRGTAVLEDGVKYKNIGLPPEDSQFLETRKFQRGDICGLMHVPPHMIGDLERSTNNNIEHQGMDFVTYCLLGWMVPNEQELGRKLLTRDQIAAGYYFAYDADALLRGDQGSRYAAYAIARQWGWLNADDVRVKESMTKLPGKQGDMYLVPMNMIPADKVGIEPVSPAAAPAAPDAPASDDTPPTAPAKVRASFRAMLIDAATRAVHKETQAVRRAAKKPAAFAGEVKEFYRGHGDHVRTVMIAPASTFGDLLGLPFVTARAAVERVADAHGARAVTELAVPGVDVETLMQAWDKDKPAAMADELLIAMNV